MYTQSKAKKTEIGGDFCSVPTASVQNRLFPNETKWFLSGRSALQAIIAENRFMSISLPDWCCDSLILPFLRSGKTIVFYDALNPPDDFDTEVALVMDYFGYSSNKSYDGYNGILIRDLTHSFFSKQKKDADYYFGSLRKWAGFYTGGFAWGFKNDVIYDSNEEQYVLLRKKAMKQKELYISGLTDSKEYLCVFNEAEEMLENIEIASATDRDISFARKLDFKYLKEKHRTNAKVLLESFFEMAIFPEIKSDDCPMFVPIRVKDRDLLRKWLMQNEIYCPVHWPIGEFHKISESSRQIYNEEISLVCDQRYCENDMQRIIDTIKRYDRR